MLGTFFPLGEVSRQGAETQRKDRDKSPQMTPMDADGQMLDVFHLRKSATSADENRWFAPRGSTGAVRSRIEDDRLIAHAEDPDALELAHAVRLQQIRQAVSPQY